MIYKHGNLNVYRQPPDIAETELCLEDMITAREEGKKRKKDVMEAGKRRKKEVWCGNHGEVAWGEAGSSNNGQNKRKIRMKAT